MNKLHKLKNIHIEDNSLCLNIDGKDFKMDLKSISPILAGANNKERAEFEVSPSGYGIHWPLIDEDISIDGLLGIKHMPENTANQSKEFMESNKNQHAY
ncbi:MAG: DUF2442 domain-containing protein [bacterium]|nr:DUF2442 domain-containing protein [Candidatus Thioglobus pontius]